MDGANIFHPTKRRGAILPSIFQKSFNSFGEAASLKVPEPRPFLHKPQPAKPALSFKF
jgi:hypothetical protein